MNSSAAIAYPKMTIVQFRRADRRLRSKYEDLETSFMLDNVKSPSESSRGGHSAARDLNILCDSISSAEQWREAISTVARMLHLEFEVVSGARSSSEPIDYHSGRYAVLVEFLQDVALTFVKN